MSYVPHTPADLETMLAVVGASGVEELFETVPASLRGNAELKLGSPVAEASLLRELSRLAASNRSSDRCVSFLGGGSYRHFIPSAIDHLVSRGEFLTAYTPYQAEISQGTLQAVFEFQTLICQLTGLEVANASLYDGASASAEAVLLAIRATRKRRIFVSEGIHPHYLEVIRTYTGELDVVLEPLRLGSDGCTPCQEFPEDTAAIVLQNPSFFGCIEQPRPLAHAAHAVGALLIVTTAEPLSLALLSAPGTAGADVVCGEAQSFGVPTSFGGPYVGFMAARQKFVRQLPGRLVGETVDSDGRRAFVMTLTTREQHIRRERATSNICTNQGLCALRVVVYLALLGKAGLRKLAAINLSLAEYAKAELAKAGLSMVYPANTFNEFVVRVPNLANRLASAYESDLLPGIALDSFDSARQDQLLVCVTELNSRADVEKLVEVLTA